mmetsp:Transcript_36050/g.61488  ORF Transcript_36050/g.61488 Transcript_36050/m.61488 type:complete len:459 (+) Transcript_36050:126-1502(+)
MSSANNGKQNLIIKLPPGSLGVTIQKSIVDGRCIVISKTNNASPFEVGDVIVSINGITLKDVGGGVPAWVNLISTLSTANRTFVVQRTLPSAPQQRVHNHQQRLGAVSGSSRSGGAPNIIATEARHAGMTVEEIEGKDEAPIPPSFIEDAADDRANATSIEQDAPAVIPGLEVIGDEAPVFSAAANDGNSDDNDDAPSLNKPGSVRLEQIDDNAGPEDVATFNDEDKTLTTPAANVAGVEIIDTEDRSMHQQLGPNIYSDETQRIVPQPRIIAREFGEGEYETRDAPMNDQQQLGDEESPPSPLPINTENADGNRSIVEQLHERASDTTEMILHSSQPIHNNTNNEPEVQVDETLSARARSSTCYCDSYIAMVETTSNKNSIHLSIFDLGCCSSGSGDDIVLFLTIHSSLGEDKSDHGHIRSFTKFHALFLLRTIHGTNIVYGSSIQQDRPYIGFAKC